MMIQCGFHANFGKMCSDCTQLHTGLINEQVYIVHSMTPSQKLSTIIACRSEIFSRYSFQSVLELGMVVVMSVNRRVLLAKIRKVLSHAGRAQE